MNKTTEYVINENEKQGVDFNSNQELISETREKVKISDKEVDSNKKIELARIERKNLRNKQKSEIIEKFKCGMSYAELEQEYKNFGRSTIRNLLSPYAKIKKEEKIKKSILLHEQGHSIREIAKILSCSKNTVNKYILSQKKIK